ncbi:GDP/GTP exchange factor Sec2p-domain-containing protein [Chlamydoabsidia padenii]|nr:GDP/GTP exchange factor Sec2p-domain-containing protein [Chlamydoabsidia padenii]
MESQEDTIIPSSISTNSDTSVPAANDVDVTAKDIAKLYSRLQSVMNRTNHEPNNDAKFIPLPASLPLSPSVSSPGKSSPNSTYFPYTYNNNNNNTSTTPPAISSNQNSPTKYKATSLGASDGTLTGSPISSSPAQVPLPSSDSSSLSNEAVSDCPCHHILISKDSRHCGLCDRVIPVMEALLKERDTHEHEIKLLQQRLAEEQIRIQEQTNDISQLQMSVRQVEKQLNVKTEAFLALQSDMEMLNDKYVDEIERVAEIQHSKDMVENELEDLSRRLFEEANGMVANEKREKHNLEVAQKHLENQLKETRDRLAAEQMQLQELRLKMEAMQDFENEHYGNNNSNNNNNYTNNNYNYINGNGNDNINGNSNRNSDVSLSVNGSINGVDSTDARGIKDLAGLFPDHLNNNNDQHQDMDPWPGLDSMLLDEFADFVKLRTSVPLKKLHNIPFMKHCQLEDVDPCLRFGAHSRLSARKVNDAIVMNTCFIEEAPVGFADEQSKRPVDVPLKISAGKSMIWERFSSSGSGHQSGVFAGCQACGRNNDALPYRFRISYFDDWACIDRYCRDRLVAVCEFYVFIRNVRQGYYNSRTTTDLYQEAMRLRLQMFYARMGALPWTIRSLGVKGDKIGSATSPQLEIPEPPVSESSPLPRRNSSAHDSNKRSGSMDEKIMTETNEATTTMDTSNDNKDKHDDDKKLAEETPDDNDDKKEDIFVDADDQ